MRIKVEALLCCIIATSLAANEPRSKKKDDPRGKRNLDYSISHHFPGPNYRSERRISTVPQISQIPHYPLFYPIQKPYAPFRKGRPNLPTPPYAVQMEPLVHYSQRDPLYDANGLTFIGDGSNDIKNKEDHSKEHSHTSRSIYGQPEPKHIIERPVYIKEPEPIIEIIIKESNTTLPPLPTVPVTLAPRKKEQVQVFYVKYKKNPNSYGKDTITYDKPIPALSPHIPDEPVQVEPPVIKYEIPSTNSPPPTTTLRAIVKPDSETYHADKGIHITFGKQENEQYKRSNENINEESAPEPAISEPLRPQGRQFFSTVQQFPPPTSFIQKRPPSPPTFQNGPPTFKHETQRFPSSYRPFGQQSVQFKQQPFGRQFSQGSQVQSHSQFTTTRPVISFPSQSFPPRTSTFQQFPGPQHVHFGTSLPTRQPVPYQPFDQLRVQHNQPSQQSQIQFPRTHTHFPIHQQLPHVQHQQTFNSPFSNEQQHLQATQQQFQNNLKHDELIRQQQFHSHTGTLSDQPKQISQLQPQHQIQQHIPQLSQQFIHQQQNSQQPQLLQQHNIKQHQGVSQFSFNNQAQPERIIPPGGELIQSLPKYEQHISIPSNSGQSQALSFQNVQPSKQQTQSQPQQQLKSQLSPQEYNIQIQQQFKQTIPTQQTQTQTQATQHSGFILNSQVFPQQTQQKSFPRQEDLLSLHQTTTKPIIQTSTASSTTTTSEKPKSSSQAPEKLTEKDLKDLNIELPDEVPDDLREQLLSSGILKNAQISVLDYDKVGDIPLSALPPDQLANFYGAGGAQQIAAASEQLPIVVEQDGKPLEKESASDDLEMEGAESEVSEVKVDAPLEMKVVHYDPKTEEGQEVQESYIQDNATQVDPVALNDQQYNRYLPVKVNGAAFPIPDVPELKGRNITSVVVLAPVDYSFQENQRTARDVESTPDRGPRQHASEALKELIKNPTTDNYKDWLDKENKTIPDKQAVVLLVAGNEDSEKEIFMYDIATQTVSKLSGELSSAFVDAAETNSKQTASPAEAPSNVVETRVPYPEGASIDRQDFSAPEDTAKDLDDAASEYVEAKIPLIDPTQNDKFGAASEQLESFVDISGMPVQPAGDLAVAASDANALAAKQVSISSGYSKTGSNLFS